MFFYRLVRPQNQGLALKYSSILESSGISIALDLAGPHPAKFVAKYYATNQIGPILPREFFFHYFGRHRSAHRDLAMCFVLLTLSFLCVLLVVVQRKLN